MSKKGNIFSLFRGVPLGRWEEGGFPTAAQGGGGEGRGGEGRGGWISSVGGVPTGKNGSFFDAGVPVGVGGFPVTFQRRVRVGSDGQKGEATVGTKKKVESYSSPV